MKKGNDNDIKTVAVATLGCKVNQCESAAFRSCFAAQGFSLLPAGSFADIYVINTCAVTAKAAAQSRQLIRRAQRSNPRAKLVVTGCYAQVAPQKIREIAPDVVIVGNADKHRLCDATLSDRQPHQSLQQNCTDEFFSDIAAPQEFRLLPVNRFSGRTRAFLKIQDGCSNFCSYCIVPHARGRSRSLAPDMVLHQVRLYAQAGHKEIVLTGIHVGHYGLDLKPASSLLALLQELSRATPEMRYRISSLEPSEINGELLHFIQTAANLMPHLHIPMQSGSDVILKKMHRRYTADEFKEKVTRCKTMVPAAAIGVDVLVGFPGETEEDFRRTYDLVANLPVSYMHVFPYSKRPGTPAAKMSAQVPAKIKEERVAILRELDHKKRTAFYGGGIGEVHPVLVETDRSVADLAKGFTDNYIPVHFRAGPDVANRIVAVKLESVQKNIVFGRLL